MRGIHAIAFSLSLCRFAFPRAVGLRLKELRRHFGMDGVSILIYVF